MDIKKRLTVYNSMTLIVPFIVTILTAFIFIFISSKFLNTNIGYDNFKKLEAIKSQLLNISAEISPSNIEDAKFEKYLYQKLSNVNGDIIILKNNNVIFNSMDINKIDIQKFFQENNRETISIDGNQYIFHIIPLNYDDSSTKTILIVPLGDDSNVLKIFIITIISIFIFSCIITNIFVSYLFSRRIVSPIESLKKATSEISRGDLSFEIIEDGDSEIRDLCSDFEKMRIQLKNSIHMKMKYDEDRKILVSSISHDLKTPITSIKGYVEGILDGVTNTPEKLEHYLKTIYSKSQQIDKMIDDLLLYSKLDLNQIPFNFEKTDIVEYFTYCVEESAFELNKLNIDISLQNNLNKCKYVMIDRERFTRVALNIINNSKKYMGDTKNSNILISLRENNASILIEIKDNGSGISQNDIHKIFDRFYRADSARTETKGSGLGLAIAKQIVEGHKGKIWAASEEGKGTSITISLPKLHERQIIYDEKDFNN
ncbi:HAMP domain-containing sensor histidine kinase [Clostridium sp. AWRP]|uniref:sensor histidine kinase n=1 Tax=Clostridium sp. AWRP TaxID=2212991 RepID=UPI000FDAE84A|nr:HAMP domain-containing sensor histidine kinase [Clostridium sp. AWRP]AZV55503.1 HAMP domain-containing protein [Clostridium sp. AWRP]